MRTLVIATITAACLAIAAPSFAAPKGEKPRQKQQQNDKGQKGEKLIAKIEDKLGKELTADQKQQIQQATRTMNQSMKPLQETFVQSVANAVKISTEDVKAAMKGQQGQPKVKQKGAGPAARITAALETHLNRKLTDEETTAITAAMEQRRESAKPLYDEYVAELSKITGLSAEDMKDVLPQRLEA